MIRCDALALHKLRYIPQQSIPKTLVCGFLHHLTGIMPRPTDVFKLNGTFVVLNRVGPSGKAEGDRDLENERRSMRMHVNYVLIRSETNDSEEGVPFVGGGTAVNNVTIIWCVGVVKRDNRSPPQLW